MPAAADQSPEAKPSRRRRRVLAGGLALTVALALAGWGLVHWLRQAPEAARLLPESDAVIYVNLRPLRLASVFASMPAAGRDPGYQQFIFATGFNFERDLEEAAIAVHLPPPLSAGSKTPAGAPAAPETRYSEVFIGHFDVPRLAAYFSKNSQRVEQLEGREIFVVPAEEREVRVALVSPHLVLVTNSDDVDVMRQMLARAGAPAFAEGPRLVRDYYRQVPAGSLAWGLAQPRRTLPLPEGLEIPIPAQTTWVASVRYAGSIELEAQAIARSEQDAGAISESLNTLLALFRSVQANTQPHGADPDVKAFFDSLEVHQDRNRAVITADMPAGFLRKLVNEAR